MGSLFRVPDFDMAFDLCNAAERPDLTARVHLLKGQFLEDQGQFQLAETEFIAAGKPNEALLMYIHEGMLDAAQKVADAHCTVEEKNQVYTALGNKKFEKGDYDSAEKLFLKSDNVEHLVSLYLDINRLDKVGLINYIFNEIQQALLLEIISVENFLEGISM